jgi:hypothetical protein
MIWTPERNAEQGRLVAKLYAASAGVPCERKSVLAAGLPGADRRGTVAQSGTDLSRYLPVSVDTVLEEMAACGLIPAVAGLSPMEGSPLAHAEAQFIAKRVAMLALAEGRNLLLEISMASRASTDSWIAALHAAGYTIEGIFAEISIEESVRRTDAAHRRGQEDLRRGQGHGGRYIPPEAIRALASPSADAAARPPGAAWYPGGGEVARMISDYRQGRLTLHDLASDFQSRTWSSVPRDWAAELSPARDAIDDLEPVIAGTFDDVVHAYDRGAITTPDYAVLALAAAQASR